MFDICHDRNIVRGGKKRGVRGGRRREKMEEC